MRIFATASAVNKNSQPALPCFAIAPTRFSCFCIQNWMASVGRALVSSCPNAVLDVIQLNWHYVFSFFPFSSYRERLHFNLRVLSTPVYSRQRAIQKSMIHAAKYVRCMPSRQTAQATGCFLIRAICFQRPTLKSDPVRSAIAATRPYENPHSSWTNIYLMSKSSRMRWCLCSTCRV
jgi:hypothetical protein